MPQSLGMNKPDGTLVGLTSTSKLAFYGGTPAVRATLTNAAVATTAAISTTSAKWGFSTSTQANAIVALLNEIRSTLVSLGLMA